MTFRLHNPSYLCNTTSVAWVSWKVLMSETRQPAASQVPLARLALLAGEAFGHQSAQDVSLTYNPYFGQVRPALALALIVCVMIGVYLAV